MLIKKIFAVLIFFLPLTIISCSDSPTSAGKDLLKQDYVSVKVLDSFSDSIGQSSSYFKVPGHLGSSETNLIGNHKNVEASMLIRFFITFPDSIKDAYSQNSLNLISSTVEFYQTYTFGDADAPFDFTVHKINNGWTFDGFTADSLPTLSYDPNDISFNKVFTDSLNTFNINNNVVKGWIDRFVNSSSSDNFGVYIKPVPGTKKVVGYQALSLISEKIPVLKVVVEKPGAFTDTLTFISGADVSVAAGSLPSVSPENIVVQSGLAINSKVKFDVSSIPFGAIVNNAKLTLTLDTLETVIGKGSVNSLTASFSVSDTAAATVVMSRSGNTYTTDISSFVQRWIENSNKNEGIILSSSDLTGSFDLFVIKGSSTSNLALKPRLTVTYLSRN